MPDFTSVFTQERDHWQARAEAAEAELALRDGYQVRPMTETESNLLTQVLDLRRERAEARAEVERLREAGANDRQYLRDVSDVEHRKHMDALAKLERLRGALDGLAARWTDELAEDNTNGYGAGVERCLDELRDVLRGDQ